MITVKQIYKGASMLLLCALLVSCGGNVNVQVAPMEPLGEPLPKEETVPDLYCVVVSSDCTATLWDAAQTLAEAITARTGVACERMYEHERIIGLKQVVFLYLGWIHSSPEASQKLQGLKRDDYLCVAVNTGIVLGGKTDAATCAAAERFAREILPTATASALMRPDGGFSYASDEYAMDTVRLNGFDLHEYAIVYPTDASEALKALALALRAEITSRSGYVLSLLSEDRFDPSEKGIFLGTEEPLQEGESAYWLRKDNGVLLTAWSFFGVSVATERFCAHLLSAESAEPGNLVVSATQVFDYIEGPYRLFSVDSAGRLPFASPAEVTRLVDPVLTREPHVAFFGRVPAEFSGYLTESLRDYTALSLTAEDGSSVVAYGKDECVTWERTYSLTGTDLTVSFLWVGDPWSGFRVCYVSGTITRDTELCLSELCDGEEPTVILIHLLRREGALTLTDTESLGGILSESYTVEKGAYAFACYTTAELLRAYVEPYGAEDAHRFVTVERTSAF